jgi:hypothetical protein
MPKYFCNYTIAEKEALYTKKEIERAKLVMEYQKRFGFPSLSTLKAALLRGIDDSPILPVDVNNAIDIYTQNPSEIKGKMTHINQNSIRRNIVSMASKDQELFLDIMFVNGVPFLVGISKPMNFVMGLYLKGFVDKARSGKSIKEGINKMVLEYSTRGYNVTKINFDNEGDQKELKTTDVLVDPKPPGQHVYEIERCIRTIKERVRSLESASSYPLKGILLNYCVLYAINTLNLFNHSNAPHTWAPVEQFFGFKLNLKRDFKVGFGDAIEAYDSNNSTPNSATRPRTNTCIVLLHKYDGNGTVLALNLDSMATVTRSHYKIIPLSDIIVNVIKTKLYNETTPTTMNNNNDVDESDSNNNNDNLNVESSKTNDSTDDIITNISSGSNILNNQNTFNNSNDDPTPDYDNKTNKSSTNTQNISNIPNNIDNIPINTNINDNLTNSDILVNKNTTKNKKNKKIKSNIIREENKNKILDDKKIIENKNTGDKINQSKDKNNPEEKNETAEYTRKSQRLIDKNNNKVLNTNKIENNPTINAVDDEIKQLITEYKAITPVDPKIVNKINYKKIIYSNMMIKTKKKPDGSIDKIKARLVIGGDQVNKSLYDQLRSPTVNNLSIMTVLGIAAKEKRLMSAIDIKGAFLNAPMIKDAEGDDAYFRASEKVSEQMIKLYPYLEKFLNPNKTLVFKLNKAVYGHPASPKLWNQVISNCLKELNLKPNDYDECVFNGKILGADTTICNHVDDLLVTTKSKEALEEIYKVLKKKFINININEGSKINYLGMSIELKNNKVIIKMEKIINEITQNINGLSEYPASIDLFNINDKSNKLNEKDKEYFHSTIAKLLYLSIRIRPDIATAVAYLTTRVTNPTEDDLKKLIKILKYLNNTKSDHLIIQPALEKEFVINCFIDASYGINESSRSQSGITINFGKGSIYHRSSKQKYVAKSSTEAEINAISNTGSILLWLKNFLSQLNIYNVKINIFEDNKSAITILKNGIKFNSKANHINNKLFWIKQFLDDGTFNLHYIDTDNNIADLLTKPILGNKFKSFKKKLLNLN